MEAISQVQTQTQTQTQPNRKPISQQPIVKRMVGFKEVQGDSRRIGTIMYEYNRETRTLRYGASIFRTSASKPEHFDGETRKKHLKTALSRFEKHPVIVENFSDDSTLQDFHGRVRQLLFTHRCRSGLKTTGSSGKSSGNHSDNQSTDSQ